MGDLRLLRVEAVAEKLGCSVQGVWKFQREGKIPRSRKLGSITVWSSDDLDRCIRNMFREAA